MVVEPVLVRVMPDEPPWINIADVLPVLPNVTVWACVVPPSAMWYARTLFVVPILIVDVLADPKAIVPVALIVKPLADCNVRLPLVVDQVEPPPAVIVTEPLAV